MRIGETSMAESLASISEREPRSGGGAGAGDADAPVGAGDTVPSVEVVAPDGRTLDLEAMVSTSPTVLVVRPRGLSPLADARLEGLWQIGQALADLGYQIVVVSADDERDERKAEAEARPRRSPARSVPDAAGALSSRRLPMPAVFVIGCGGRIAFAHWNPDYRDHLEPEKVLAAARAARNRE